MEFKTSDARRAAQREANRRWREKHRTEDLARQAAYRAANREREVARVADWRRRNRDVVSSQNSIFRARRTGVDANLTHQEWLDLLEEFDHTCAYCQARGVKLTQEHMTPISRGGRHTKSNVVPACVSCNSQKGTKTALEFLAS